jgi:hypothetical protein
MNFLKWYKNKIESGEEHPPADLWDDIQNDLDIDLVYERLEKSLSRDRRKVWLWRASAAAGILLLISAGMLFLLPPEPKEQLASQEPSRNEFQADTLQIAPPADSSDISDISNSGIEETFQKQEPLEGNPVLPISDPVPKAHIVAKVREIETDPSPDTQPFENTMKLRTDEDLQLPVVEYTPSPGRLATNNKPSLPELSMEEEQEKGAFATLEISVTGELANTWLVNNKTIEGMDPQEFTATRPTFNGNYGMSLATNLGKRWDLVGQINLSRNQGQNYREYIEGNYVSNNIRLEYFDLALMARYRPFRNNENHFFSAGLYHGFLRDATRQINGQTTNISQEYTDTDVGIIAGYEYRTPISDNLTLGAGAFMRSGLKNVYAGNQLISSTLNQSYNTSFNFKLSVGYTFSL